MRLLYYAPFSRGGLAEYSHHQASALARVGLDVTVLCPARNEGPWHRTSNEPLPYALQPILRAGSIRALPAIPRKLLFVRDLLMDAHTLARVTRHDRFPCVLIAAYNEMLSPLWTGPMRQLARTRGVVFGAIVHDPTRVNRFGPLWWHRRSITTAYAMLREAFVHSPIVLDTGTPMPGLRTTVVPQGLYPVPASQTTRTSWRIAHRLPEDAMVLLSFGYLRDDKNLDLALRALSHFSEMYIVVAGAEQSGTQRSAESYRALAQELGVENRCRWLVGFVPDEEVSAIFQACDLLLLTYSRRFRSASAVFNMAAGFRIPCLASGGRSNLHDIIHEFGLAVWIEPDSLDAMIAGIRRWQRGEMPAPRWADYELANSWQRNAEVVAEKMGALG